MIIDSKEGQAESSFLFYDRGYEVSELFLRKKDDDSYKSTMKEIIQFVSEKFQAHVAIEARWFL